MVKVYKLWISPQAKHIVQVHQTNPVITFVGFFGEDICTRSGSYPSLSKKICKANFCVNTSITKNVDFVGVLTPNSRENIENLVPAMAKISVGQTATSDSAQLREISRKMDMIMQTLVLMEKRLTLVEDQLKLNETH